MDVCYGCLQTGRRRLLCEGECVVMCNVGSCCALSLTCPSYNCKRAGKHKCYMNCLESCSFPQCYLGRKITYLRTHILCRGYCRNILRIRTSVTSKVH